MTEEDKTMDAVQEVTEYVQEKKLSIGDTINAAISLYLNGWFLLCKSQDMSASAARKMFDNNLKKLSQDFYENYKEIRGE